MVVFGCYEEEKGRGKKDGRRMASKRHHCEAAFLFLLV